MKTFPRMSAGRHITAEDIAKISPRRARAILEQVSPHLFKPRRVRNIVRRTLLKSKAKEFVAAVDAVLAAVDRVYDLNEQLTAMNPGLLKAQRDGSLARQHNEAVEHLVDSWKKIVFLV